MHTQTSATIASLIMGSADAEDLSLEQIQVDLEGEQAGDIMGGSLRYEFGRIAVGQAALGSLSIAARVQKHDSSALGAMATDYEETEANHGGEIGQPWAERT